MVARMIRRGSYAYFLKEQLLLRRIHRAIDKLAADLDDAKYLRAACARERRRAARSMKRARRVLQRATRRGASAQRLRVRQHEYEQASTIWRHAHEALLEARDRTEVFRILQVQGVDALLAERDSVLRCSEMWRERGLRLVEARGLRVEAEARGLQVEWARPPQEQEHHPCRNFDSTRGYPGEGPAAPNKDGRKKASCPRKLDQQETAAQGQGPHQKPAVGGISWEDQRVHAAMGFVHVVQLHEGEYQLWHEAWGKIDRQPWAILITSRWRSYTRPHHGQN